MKLLPTPLALLSCAAMRALFCALFFLSLASALRAELVGYWDLNGTLAASSETSAVLTTHLDGIVARMDYGTGTSVNLLPGYSAGQSRGYFDLAGIGTFEGRVQITSINLVGLSLPTISFAIKKDLIAEAFSYFYVEMNTGSGWEFVENLADPDDSYSLRTVTITDPGVAGIPDLGLRIVFGADFDFVDIVEVDNVQVNAVPEPSAVLFVGCAALLLGIMAQRGRRAARR